MSSVTADGLSAILLDTLKTYPTFLLYLLGQKNNSTLALAGKILLKSKNFGEDLSS